MSKKLLIVLSVLSLMIAVFAQADPSQVYGKWQATMAQNGTEMTMALDIDVQQSVISNTCSYSGQTGSVSVTVPSQVTATQWMVTGNGTASKNVAGLDCSLNVTPMQFDYKVDSTSLVLSISGTTVQFTRVK